MALRKPPTRGVESAMFAPTVAPQKLSCSNTRLYPVKPVRSVHTRRHIPTIQLISRGLR
jgi:hypothetical protein